MTRDQQKILETVQKIREVAGSYYTERPSMSDAEFDALEEELRHLEPRHPYFSEVGFGQGRTEGEKIAHRIPMLSLGKAKNIQEVAKWLQNLSYADETDFVVEPKVDGLSANLFYRNGRLRYIVTRGDGKTGQDVSHIADYIPDIPRQLQFTSRSVEIRGELHLPNDTAYDTGDKPLRNNCVGLINRKDGREDLKYVRFLAYQILWSEAAPEGASLAAWDVLKEDERLASESGKLRLLAAEGFYTFEPKVVGSVSGEAEESRRKIEEPRKENEVFNEEAEESRRKTLSQLEEYYREYNDVLREKWNFETDGLVLMVNRCRLHGLIDQERVVSHHHHYALALKAPSLYMTTRLLDIRWQVSRQGSLIPVAIFEPGVLGGARLQKASLHNASNVERLRLRKGDRILVERANDVIPYVKGNLEEAEREEGYRDESLWPETCPSCGRELKREGVNIRCPDGTCRDRVIQELLFWVREMDIAGVARRTLEALYDAGKLRGIAGLYRIGSEDFVGVEGFGPKKLENFLGQVMKSRSMNTVTFITALGIPMVQQRTLEKLGIKTLGDFLDFEDTSYVVGQRIVEWKSDKENMKLLEGLIEVLDVKDESGGGGSGSASGSGEAAYRGNICLTGIGPVSRKELVKLLEERGWKAAGTVTSETAFLLCDDPGRESSKLKKARALGVGIQTYQDFFKSLQ